MRIENKEKLLGKWTSTALFVGVLTGALGCGGMFQGMPKVLETHSDGSESVALPTMGIQFKKPANSDKISRCSSALEFSECAMFYFNRRSFEISVISSPSNLEDTVQAKTTDLEFFVRGEGGEFENGFDLDYTYRGKSSLEKFIGYVGEVKVGDKVLGCFAGPNNSAELAVLREACRSIKAYAPPPEEAK